MSVDEPVAEMNKLEQGFSEIIKARVNADQGKKLKIDKDATFTENPMDRENMEETIEVNRVQPLYEVFTGLKQKGLKNLELIRVPVVEESAPREACFDILVDSLKQEPAGTHCVFSCQAGCRRTTLGKQQHTLCINHGPFYYRYDNCMPG